MEHNGNMYMANNMGPKMEPWGTPQVMGADKEKEGATLDTDLVFEAVRRTAWSTISKAELRSRTVRTEGKRLEVKLTDLLISSDVCDVFAVTQQYVYLHLVLFI